MRDVAGSFNVFLDGIEIDTAAIPIETTGDVEELARLLDDPHRTTPVIAVSTDLEGASDGRFLLDPNGLARNVFGVAHVRSMSWGAAFALTDRIGKHMSVFQGAVRVWHPGFPVSGKMHYNHPLFLGARIASEGVVRVRDAVTNDVLQAAALRRDADRLVPSFAQVRRAASELGRHAAQRSHASDRELLALYEDTNQRLERVLSEQKSTYDELLAGAEADWRAALDEQEELERENAKLRSQIELMSAALRSRAELPEIVIPSDFEGVGAWAELNLGDGVVVLSRAIRSARRSMHDNPALAYRALLLLKDAYVPMRRGSLASRERWQTGLAQLGLEEGPTFAGSRSGEFRDEYFVDWNGRRRELDWHLKGSNSRNPQRGFRMYLFWCDDSKRVVVGSFPSHLTTGIT